MLKRLMKVSLLLLPLTTLAAPKEIIFWHAMAGQLGEEVTRIAAQFNESQSDYRIKLVYKGDYSELLTSFAAAYRAKSPPHLVQISEVGSSVIRLPKGIVKPVEILMREQGFEVPKSSIFPVVLSHYSDHDVLLAMPFNIFIPVIFYNADVLAKLGISSENFPSTWDALEVLAKRIRESGFKCAYTTTYPGWILIESYLAIQGLSSTDEVYSPEVAQAVSAQLKRLRRWQKLHYFEYGGRGDHAMVLFTSGRCPLMSQSSGSYQGLSHLTSFKIGIAPMPFDSTASPIRHNNVVGGAGVWVVAGQSSEMERGIAKYFAFLSQEAIQKRWYENTGYLPLYYQPQQTSQAASMLDIAAFDLNHAYTLGFNEGPKNQIRAIHDQMLEAIFSGIMDPEKAMKKARVRKQHALDRFKKNTLE